jgi:hypothetical protein
MIERAFELARSGRHPSVSHIKAQLKRENYLQVEGHILGRSLIGSLRRIIAEARRIREQDETGVIQYPVEKA